VGLLFLRLSLAFPLATAASEDRGKACAILPPPPFRHPNLHALTAASTHFPAAASLVLPLKIPLGLLGLGRNLARHPLEIPTSAFLCLPFHWLPPLQQQPLPSELFCSCDKKRFPCCQGASKAKTVARVRPPSVQKFILTERESPYYRV